MTEPLWAWIAVIGGLLVVIAIDLWIVDRGEAREFSMRQAGYWVTFYVALAAAFAVLLEHLWSRPSTASSSPVTSPNTA